MMHTDLTQNAETVRLGRVGFTGTRAGMTDAQRSKVNRLLRELAPIWAHHGDCIGADDQFHDLAKLAHAKVMIHPPEKRDLRAFRLGDDIAQEKHYLERNRDIVDACETLIATPKESTPQHRGGTWYTIGYARLQGRKTVIVWPDGSTLVEGEETPHGIGWDGLCDECDGNPTAAQHDELTYNPEDFVEVQRPGDAYDNYLSERYDSLHEPLYFDGSRGGAENSSITTHNDRGSDDGH